LVHELGRKGPRTTKELLDITTNFASGEESVGAIFNPVKAKGKQQEDTNEDGSSRNSKKKKKNKQRRGDNLVATAECKNNWPPLEGAPGVFDEMLEKPCPYHQGPVKHTLKECDMMKHYFFEGTKGKGGQGKKLEEDKGNGSEKDDDFPVVNNCMMIFGGPTAYNTKRQRKLDSRATITFDRDDHLVHVPQPG
jgi:hypothetical protein